MAIIYFKKIQYCYVEVDIKDDSEAKKLVGELIDNSSKFTMLDLCNGNFNDEEMDDDNKELFDQFCDWFQNSPEAIII